MGADKRMEITISLKDQFTKNMKGVGKSLDNIKSRVKSVSSSLFNLKTAFLGLGAGLVAKSFINAASAAEQYQLRLEILLGSQEEGNKVFKETAEYASKVSFQYEELMAGATALGGVLEGGSEDIKRWLPLIGDLAAASGLAIQDTISNFIRMYSAGAASADLFRERGILAMLGFQAGVTYSAEETRKRLIEAWEDPLSKFRGAATALSSTWDGLLSMMADRWFQFRSMVMDAGLYNYIKNAVDLMLGKLTELKEKGKLDEWAAEMSSKVINSFETMALGVAEVYDVLMPVMRAFKNMFVGLWDWFKELPREVQTYGLIVFFLLGKKGKVAIAMILALENALKPLQEWVAKDFETPEVAATQIQIEGLQKKIESFKESLKDMPDWSEFGVSCEYSLTTEKIKELEDQLLQLKGAKIESVIDTEKIKEEEKSMVSTLESIFKALRAKREPEEKKLKPVSVGMGVVKPEAVAPFDGMSQAEKDLLSLEVLYQRGEEELIFYLERRKALVLQVLNEEIKKLEEVAKAETDSAERLAAEDAIFVKKQEYAIREIELQKDIAQAYEDSASRKLEVESMMADLRSRTREEIDALQAAELAEMDERHRLEYESFKTLLDDKLAAELGYINESDALKDILASQQLEKEKLQAEQAKEIWDKRLALADSAGSTLKEIFEDLYELGGSKSKDMFALMKKAAIAEAIINTAKAVSGALGTPPYGLGAIATAALIAIKGGIQIAKIKAQEMAEGGLVGGFSPNTKADNIPIKGTAGEFMQPVSAVKHLGLRVMEGIRRNVFPKELFEGFKFPAFARTPSGSGYAEGGVVSGGSSNFSVSVPVNISDGRAADIAGMLQSEVEETVVKVMERELR